MFSNKSTLLRNVILSGIMLSCNLQRIRLNCYVSIAKRIRLSNCYVLKGWVCGFLKKHRNRLRQKGQNILNLLLQVLFGAPYFLTDIMCNFKISLRFFKVNLPYWTYFRSNSSNSSNIEMQMRSLLKIVLESFLVSTLGRLFAAHFLSHTRSVVFMICDKMIFRNIDIFIHKCYFKRMNHTIHQLSNEEKKAEVISTKYFLRLISFRCSCVIPEVLMQIHSSVRPHVCTQ